MNVRVSYDNLVRQLMPIHKRQNVRLRFIRGLISPVKKLFEDFDLWRTNTRIEMSVTGQVGVLEGYLRNKFKEQSIFIKSFIDDGLPVGLYSEDSPANFYLNGSEVSTLSLGLVPLRGEVIELFEDLDFIVIVPAYFDDIKMELIKIDIERFKRVLVKYKIQKNEKTHPTNRHS